MSFLTGSVSLIIRNTVKNIATVMENYHSVKQNVVLLQRAKASRGGLVGAMSRAAKRGMASLP